MEYILANINRGFIKIDDPYRNGRQCFEFLQIDRTALYHIYHDKKFLFINGNVIYFDKQ